jgi:Fe-S-cluster-containing dehydrogenase component
LALREVATFALVCRRCEEPSCVAACRFDALERQSDGVLKRYNMRCVSCKSCSQACPFGTIYPETIPFYVSNCDFCTGSGKEPPCVPRCEKKAIEFREVEASDKDGIYLLNEHVAVRAPRWNKKDV